MAQFVTVTLSNETKITEEVLNPDRVRWDITAAKKKWPKFSDSPFLGMTFLAWAALKRKNHYSGTFEEFSENDCLDIDMTDAEGNPLDEEDLAGN